MSVLYVAKKTDKFYVQRKKRTCDELDICEVDAITGEVKVLINETDKPYFNDDFYHISFLNDGEISYGGPSVRDTDTSIIMTEREI